MDIYRVGSDRNKGDYVEIYHDSLFNPKSHKIYLNENEGEYLNYFKKYSKQEAKKRIQKEEAKRQKELNQTPNANNTEYKPKLTMETAVTADMPDTRDIPDWFKSDTPKWFKPIYNVREGYDKGANAINFLTKGEFIDDRYNKYLPKDYHNERVKKTVKETDKTNEKSIDNSQSNSQNNLNVQPYQQPYPNINPYQQIQQIPQQLNNTMLAPTVKQIANEMFENRLREISMRNKPVNVCEVLRTVSGAE